MAVKEICYYLYNPVIITLVC